MCSDPVRKAGALSPSASAPASSAVSHDSFGPATLEGIDRTSTRGASGLSLSPTLWSVAEHVKPVGARHATIGLKHACFVKQDPR